MTTSKFNREMLVLARELREMTQEDVADCAGCTQAFVSQVEASTREVTPEYAEKIAAALRLPTSFFFQDEHYTGFGISMVYYRKRSSALARHLRRLQAEVNIRRIHVKRLMREVSISTPHAFEFLDIDEQGGSPESVATRLRANWAIPLGPIRNLVSVIENAGGFIFKFPFGTNDIDAMSQWPDDAPPLFFLNSAAPADRIRFSLAHELGHVVMHQKASDDIENEADRFASQFLMPREEISAQLLDIDLAKAAALKPHWRVSMQSLIRRARDLRRITDDRYRDLFIRIGQLGYRKNEPYPIQPEEPVTFRRMIGLCLQESGIDGVCDMICWPKDEFVSKYLPPTGLRMAQ